MLRGSSRAALALLVLAVSLPSPSSAAMAAKVRDVASAGAQAEHESVYCPKSMVPARAGGFMHYSSRRGCCILDTALTLAELLYMTQVCEKKSVRATRWRP